MQSETFLSSRVHWIRGILLLTGRNARIMFDLKMYPRLGVSPEKDDELDYAGEGDWSGQKVGERDAGSFYFNWIHLFITSISASSH